MSSSHAKGTTGTPTNTRDTRSLPRQFRLSSPKSPAALHFYDITKDQLYVTKCIALVGQHPYVYAARKFLKELYRWEMTQWNGLVCVHYRALNSYSTIFKLFPGYLYVITYLHQHSYPDLSFLLHHHNALVHSFRFFIQCESSSVSLESHVYNLLYEVPAPPPGRCVALSCVGRTHTCQRPTSHELPLFEVRYHLHHFIRLCRFTGKGNVFGM